MSFTALALVLLAGLAVGATSIGGVLVVPVLTSWAGASAEQAIAAASFAFAFTGAAAFASRDRGQASPATAPGGPLMSGTLLGAALGALTLSWLPPGAVRLVVGALAVGSGLYALAATAGALRFARSASANGRDAGAAAAWSLGPLGLLVGCGSAWSGTGGPVLLLPLLTLMGWHPGAAVAAAQRVQLPVALAATAVNVAAGRLDLALGLAVGALVLAGWALGRNVARRLPLRRLQQAVALALVAAGVWYL